MSQHSEAPQQGTDGRIQTSVDGWKRKLLDLSGRNRALNFKPTKVSTITIIDEQPAEVFRHLYIQEKPMRFKAARDGDHRKAPAASLLDDSSSPSDDNLSEFEEESDALEADFVPYDPSELNERHQDDF